MRRISVQGPVFRISQGWNFDSGVPLPGTRFRKVCGNVAVRPEQRGGGVYYTMADGTRSKFHCGKDPTPTLALRCSTSRITVMR